MRQDYGAYADPLAEARLYHHPDDRGFFAVMQPPRSSNDPPFHRCYPLSDLPIVLSNIPKDWDTFISQGQFRQRRRRISTFARIGLCFVDLDTYQKDYGNLSPTDQAYALIGFCEDKGIPRPSLVVSSGQGMHAKWLLDRMIPFHGLPRWNVVQKFLIKSLEPFGADTKARDPSRLLRMVGTINTKSGQTARPVWMAEGNAAPVRWDFETLAAEVLPFTRDEVRQWRDARAAARLQYQMRREGRTSAARLLTKFCQEQLWVDRLTDLRTLCSLRGWEDGVPEGWRDSMLLIAACAASYIFTSDIWQQEVDALAEEFCPTLPLSERRNYVSSVHQRMLDAQQGQRMQYKEKSVDPRYRFTNDRLVDMLQIEWHEEKHMRTIISRGVAAERHRRRNRKDPNMDRATYEAQARRRREQAKALRGTGLSYKGIAERMGIPVKAVDNLLNR